MHEYYENPLCGRYAGEEMKRLFSDDVKFSTWRKLWIALAESEKELGLAITDGQIDQMKAHIYDIDYESAARHEHEVRHDVMAHVLTYGEACPDAKPIIHLGATSCYVGDNTDIIRMRDALVIIRRLLVSTVDELCRFAGEYSGMPALAYTHFQAAQPTTVGKRATLWINDLLMDLEQLEFQLSNLSLLGCKGTTGTCASFLELFGGDEAKCLELEKKIAEKMGFDRCVPVSGQTYSRKVDFAVLQVLSGIAQSAAKFSNDIRLLSHEKEVDEPFESKQIGSSAMAYKRNPMRSERMASLARYVMCDLQNTAMTSSGQWFERTLDDSANKRISVPEAFLATDAILGTVHQYNKRPEGLSRRRKKTSGRGVAFYGHREYTYVLRQGKGRRPPDPPRGHTPAFRGRGRAGENVRQTQRPAGADNGRQHLRPYAGRACKAHRSRHLYRHGPAPDGDLSGNRRPAGAGRPQRRSGR
jgi:adenylosuccinate lyase